MAGFAALMKMFPRDPSSTVAERSWGRVQQWTTRAPMLALTNPDPALGFPLGTVLQPTILVRNTTSQAYSVDMRFNWRSATGSGKSPSTGLALGPYETHLVDVAALQAQKMLPPDADWASVILSAPIHPDDFMAVAMSYDQTGRYGAQTPFRDQLAFHWEAGKWEVDGMHNSLVTVGNGGSKSVRAQVTIFYNQGTGSYQLEQTLAPDDQMWLDFGKLIRDRTADNSGRTLPADLTFGTYTVKDLTDVGTGNLYEGKVILDRRYGNAAYGCAWCCGLNNPHFTGNPITIPVLGIQAQQIKATNVCTGAEMDVTGSFDILQTGDSSIATASSYQVHGVGAGATTNFTSGDLVFGHERMYGEECPMHHWTPTGPVNVAQLACTSVPRGSSATCTVTPPSVTVTAWQFQDSNNNTVTRSQNVGALTWSGTMVTSGTVSATISGLAAPVTASITVTGRNWHITTPNPVEVANGTFVPLPVPPQPTGLDSGLGESSETETWPGFSSTFISDNGPNQGYGYYVTQPAFTNNYNYEINPDLENTSSTFYLQQCGNYNAQTNQGFISGSNLLTQTKRHEYNSPTQSHYAFYSQSFSGSNNPGDYVESRVAVPGTSQGTFDSGTASGLQTNAQSVTNAFSVEPFAVNEDGSGNFLGNINYAPYTPCN